MEIFIIVFAVTLSIWLHSWSENRHEQKVAKEFLNGLQEDLTKDVESFKANQRTIAHLDSNYNFLLLINKSQTVDNQLNAEINKHLIYTLTKTNPNNGRYEGFKSSGKIETIANKNLKNDILAFSQQTVPKLISSETYVNFLQLKILDLQIDKNNKTTIRDFVTKEKMQGLFGLASHNLRISIQYYNEAIKQANEIIAEIRKEGD